MSCVLQGLMCTPMPACMCVIVLVCTCIRSCVLMCVLTRPCARVCVHVCTQARAFLQQTFAQFLLGASPCESQGHAARTQMGRLRIPQRAMAPPLCPPVLPSPSKASSCYPRPHCRLPRPDPCRGAHPELHCSATQGAEPQLHQPDHPLKGAACLRPPPQLLPTPCEALPASGLHPERPVGSQAGSLPNGSNVGGQGSPAFPLRSPINPNELGASTDSACAWAGGGGGRGTAESGPPTLAFKLESLLRAHE